MEDSDKTEEPTEHKLDEARKKGQVFKSQDIIQSMMMIATLVPVVVIGSWMVRQMSDFAKYIYTFIPYYDIVSQQPSPLVFKVFITAALTLIPIFASALVVAIVANLVQTNFIFSTEPLTPTFSKINPIEGFKRICSMRSLVELFKQTIKVVMIGYICYKVMRTEILNFNQAVLWQLPQTLAVVRKLSIRIVSYVLTMMAGIGIMDYLYQRFEFMKNMRMSMQELKDEYKETEGNPQVKGKLRQMMRQITSGQGAGEVAQVAQATAVVTNPTHYSVALRYRQGEDQAPVVVAKGTDTFALQIRVVAEDNNVPIVENPPLARVLYSSCQVGSKIPAEVYKAVAEVLAYIFKLKRKREQLRRRRSRMAR